MIGANWRMGVHKRRLKKRSGREGDRRSVNNTEALRAKIVSRGIFTPIKSSDHHHCVQCSFIIANLICQCFLGAITRIRTTIAGIHHPYKTSLSVLIRKPPPGFRPKIAGLIAHYERLLASSSFVAICPRISTNSLLNPLLIMSQR